jgi:hypothetical protein
MKNRAHLCTRHRIAGKSRPHQVLWRGDCPGWCKLL